jgi:hypothetical protein
MNEYKMTFHIVTVAHGLIDPLDQLGRIARLYFKGTITLTIRFPLRFVTLLYFKIT